MHWSLETEHCSSQRQTRSLCRVKYGDPVGDCESQIYLSVLQLEGKFICANFCVILIISYAFT